MIASCGRKTGETELAGRFAAAEDGARWVFGGALTFGNAAAVLDAAGDLAFPSSGVVDCAAFGAVDSAAITVLLALKRRAGEAGVDLHFVNVPSPLRALADVYDVEEMLGIA